MESDAATLGKAGVIDGAAGMRGEPDEALVAAACADPAAFGSLYERYRLPVYRYLRARVGDDDAAADLTAATFERALAAIGRFRPVGGGLPAWLLRIARNAALDAARRARPTHSLDAFERGLDPAADDDPAASAVQAAEGAELRRHVAALGEPAAEAVALRYGAGLTAREIGDVIGKSEAATQKLLSRALNALREAYGVRS